MTTSRSRHLVPLALATLLCAPVAAVAQTPAAAPTAPAAPPGAGAPVAPGAPGATAPGQPAPGQDIEARVEQRIAQLQSQLQITAAQQKDWSRFADVMRANAREMDAAMQQRAREYATMNAVQNLQSYEKLAQTHAEHVQKLASAFETLYGALPAAQKQLADQAFRTSNMGQPQHAMAPGETRTQ